MPSLFLPNFLRIRDCNARYGRRICSGQHLYFRLHPDRGCAILSPRIIPCAGKDIKRECLTWQGGNNRVSCLRVITNDKLVLHIHRHQPQRFISIYRLHSYGTATSLFSLIIFYKCIYFRL